MFMSDTCICFSASVITVLHVMRYLEYTLCLHECVSVDSYCNYNVYQAMISIDTCLLTNCEFIYFQYKHAYYVIIVLCSMCMQKPQLEAILLLYE